MPLAPSYQDLVDLAIAQLTFRRPDLGVYEGDITDAQIHGGAAMADAVLRFATLAFRDTFLDGATGDALTILVNDHLNIQRAPATSSQGVMTFSRASAAAGAGTLTAGTTVATEFDANGQEVRLTLDADVVFGALDLTQNGNVTAVETGRETNAEAGTVTRIIDSVFDATISVTNVNKVAGGNPEESDEELRERARTFWTTLRRGTVDALEFGSLTVDTVRVARAVEDTTSGITTVYVSDLDGNSTAQMLAGVAAELTNWRCASSIVLVVGGTQLTTAVAVTIAQFRSGFDVAAAAADIQAAITARMQKLRVGETLYLDALIGAIIAVSPDEIYDVTITDPAADVVPSATQVIRAGTITVS